MPGMSELAHKIATSWRVALAPARLRRLLPASPGWALFVGAVTLVMALPLATIAVLCLTARESVWPHLIRTVLPGALIDTGLLVAGVGALSLLFGTGAAWLVTMYRFPGRAVLDRMLMLPLAMPSYILAYCYGE
ncbi:MAG TPA: hypothetical protein VLL28_03320, partial [Hyphomicrobiaceae bacterium]|nr:hypothetical protein [Hyphomicrobiaceae bacterium]